VRFGVIGLLCMITLSCREIQPSDVPYTVQGYQINGTVLNANSIPLEGVDVILYYNFALAQTTPLDAQQVIVTDSTRTVFVGVFVEPNMCIRELFFRHRSPGPVPHFYWDERDDSGHEVPSGKYLIRYVYDTMIVKDVPWIANGHCTATTNSFGRFTITNEHFPIGELFDIYSNADQYMETDKVLSVIYLELYKSDLHARYTVTLNQNAITKRTFTLQ
jgi:hypothetical protein